MPAIRSRNWRQPLRVAPNSYGGSASGPSGTGTVKVSLHAQEQHRVPSAGASKGQLDLGGGAGRGAIRLPRERIRATPRRSAQLVRCARRTGNQQFVSQYPSSSSSGRSPCARAIKATRSGPVAYACLTGSESHRLRCLAARYERSSPSASVRRRTERTGRPWFTTSGASLLGFPDSLRGGTPITLRPGEAESGSAGVHPDKE